MKSRIITIMLFSMFITSINAFAGLEVLTNKQSYKKGEPIYAKVGFLNDSPNSINYSFNGVGKVHIRLEKLTHGAVDFTSFEVLYDGKTYRIPAIQFSTIGRKDAGVILPYSKLRMPSYKAVDIVGGLDIGGVGGEVTRLLGTATVTTPDIVTAYGKKIKILTPGTYAVYAELDKVQIGDYTYGSAWDATLLTWTLITVENEDFMNPQLQACNANCDMYYPASTYSAQNLSCKQSCSVNYP